MAKASMHQTPNIPGTDPVIDNPKPGPRKEADPELPANDPDPGSEPGPDLEPVPGTAETIPHTRDYCGVHPTGGTTANKGQINPKAPTNGTSNQGRDNGR